jgi:hypothetical protein
MLAVSGLFFLCSILNVAAGPYNSEHPFVFYKGNNCTGKRLFSLPSDPATRNCTKNGNRCSGYNDEVRSVFLKLTKLSFENKSMYAVLVYDDSNGSTYRSGAVVEIIPPLLGGDPNHSTSFCVGSFENSRVYDWGNISFRKVQNYKLDGKISRIAIKFRP